LKNSGVDLENVFSVLNTLNPAQLRALGENQVLARVQDEVKKADEADNTVVEAQPSASQETQVLAQLPDPVKSAINMDDTEDDDPDAQEVSNDKPIIIPDVTNPAGVLHPTPTKVCDTEDRNDSIPVPRRKRVRPLSDDEEDVNNAEGETVSVQRDAVTTLASQRPKEHNVAKKKRRPTKSRKTMSSDRLQRSYEEQKKTNELLSAFLERLIKGMQGIDGKLQNLCNILTQRPC